MSSVAPRILCFEARRGREMAELIRRRGGEPVVAPAMREVPLGDNPELRDYVDRLAAGEFDLVVLLTGVGLRALAEAVAEYCPLPRLIELLGRTRLVARGPKPVAVLREWGLAAEWVAAEPNTWRELVAVLDRHLDLAGKRVALQEYGASNPELIAALAARGARVRQVNIYRWAYPEDLAPLRAAIDELGRGRVAAALFTSATQVHHLFELAGDRAGEMIAGSREVLIASIGPVCSEALRQRGWRVDLEASQGKMGRLVGEVFERLGEPHGRLP